MDIVNLHKGDIWLSCIRQQYIPNFFSALDYLLNNISTKLIQTYNLKYNVFKIYYKIYTNLY